jgi:putative addiction module killer protein
MPYFSVREYLTADGHSPFNEWLQGLRELKARARIRTRLDRVSLGNLGDHASVGEGVFELRFFFGPGYRVYYGLEGDIRIAKVYWNDYRKRNSGNQQKISG